MRTSVRCLTISATIAALAALLLPSALANADGLVPLGGGSGIVIEGDTLCTLTAIGNDYGYDRLFERQILGLGCAGDVFIAISTSGRPSVTIHPRPALERCVGMACSTPRPSRHSTT